MTNTLFHFEVMSSHAFRGNNTRNVGQLCKSHGITSRIILTLFIFVIITNMEKIKINKAHQRRYRVVLTTCCIVICTFQVTQIMKTYFDYGTIARVELKVPQVYRARDLTICFRYSDLIDLKQINKKFNVHLKNPDGMGFPEQLEFYTNLTDYLKIKDILAYTPPTSDLIKGCVVKLQNDSLMIEVADKFQCSELFNVEKYYSQEFICYSITQKMESNQQISFTKTGTSLFFTGCSYVLEIDKYFRQCGKMIPILHVGLPTWSRYFTQGVHRDVHSVSSEAYKLYFSSQNILRLGFPYSNFICEDQEYHRYQCLKECVNTRLLREIGKVSYRFIYYEDIDYRHISLSDIHNTSIRKITHRIESECDSICHRQECVFSYTATQMQKEILLFDKTEKLHIRVANPINPFLYVISIPQTALLDVFVYIGGTLGIWFGFVINHIDPFVLYSKSKRIIGKIVKEKKNTRSSPKWRLVRPSPRKTNLFPHHEVLS